jgi:hypothetical protein
MTKLRAWRTTSAVAVLFFFGIAPLDASECVAAYAADLLKISNAAFVGFVEKTEVSERASLNGPVVRVTFLVSRTFQSPTARFSGDRIELHQWAHTGRTDFDNYFQVGREYLVFARDGRTARSALVPEATYTARPCDAWELQSRQAQERLAEVQQLTR